MTRDQWKVLHRLQRVARRESLRAFQDVMAFGTGVVEIRLSGEVRHVPPSEWRLAALVGMFPTARNENAPQKGRLS